MDVVLNPTATITDYIVSALKDAAPGKVVIVSTTSEQFRVFGQVRLSKGFLEFQFDPTPDHVVAIPLEKIVYVLP